jgi:hypothetical protein
MCTSGSWEILAKDSVREAPLHPSHFLSSIESSLLHPNLLFFAIGNVKRRQEGN